MKPLQIGRQENIKAQRRFFNPPPPPAVWRILIVRGQQLLCGAGIATLLILAWHAIQHLSGGTIR